MSNETEKLDTRGVAIPLYVLCLLLPISDGFWGVIIKFAIMWLWMGWYVAVLKHAHLKIKKHSFSGIVPFIALFVFGVIISKFYFAINLISTLSPEDISLETLRTINLFLFLGFVLLVIGQVSILMKVIAATMTEEEFEQKRGKILFLLVFAPIGAMIMRKEV